MRVTGKGKESVKEEEDSNEEEGIGVQDEKEDDGVREDRLGEELASK